MTTAIVLYSISDKVSTIISCPMKPHSPISLFYLCWDCKANLFALQSQHEIFSDFRIQLRSDFNDWENESRRRP